MKVLLTLCLVVLTSTIALGSESIAREEQGNFLVLKYQDVTKQANGQAMAWFKVEGPENQDLPVQVFYRINKAPDFFQARVVDRRFSLVADKPCRFDILAFARTGDEVFSGAADLFLFGQSSVPVARKKAEVQDVGDLVLISLLASETPYWHQTGQRFRFGLNRKVDPDQVWLSLNGQQQPLGILLEPDNGFSHVPAHDRQLRSRGNQYFRQDIVYARVNEEAVSYQATYTLLVHRSRKAFNHVTAGTACCCLSMVLFSGLVLVKRRKSPWWKN